MSTKITPTVGRVVWFHPAANQATSGFTPPNEGQPLAAIIAGVVDAEAGVVHLAVFDAIGTPSSQPYVPLIQEDQNVPEGGRFATWMPYQIGQAKKAEGCEQTEKNAIPQNHATSNPGLRAHVLDMALRTPGLRGHHDVMKAAAAYQAHIEGTVAPAPQVNQKPAPGAAHPGYSTMQLHQQRVVDEKAELDERITKLVAFFDTPIFAALPKDEQARLDAQGAAMATYSVILGERIAAFAPAADVSSLPSSALSAHLPKNSARAPNLKPGDPTPV